MKYEMLSPSDVLRAYILNKETSEKMNDKTKTQGLKTNDLLNLLKSKETRSSSQFVRNLLLLVCHRVKTLMLETKMVSSKL